MWKNIINFVSITTLRKSINYSNKKVNTTQISELNKYKYIEKLIISCALGKSNISDTRVNHTLVSERLLNLHHYINQVIFNIDLNIMLHDFIDSVLHNNNFKKIYEQTN